MAEALPEHDRERIYGSDVRKLFLWYDQLLKAGEFDTKEEKKPAKKDGKKGSKAKKVAAPAAKKAAVKKKAAPKNLKNFRLQLNRTMSKI